MAVRSTAVVCTRVTGEWAIIYGGGTSFFGTIKCSATCRLAVEALLFEA